jgi:hypothetical protein
LFVFSKTLHAQQYDKVWVFGTPMTTITFEGDSVINGQLEDTALGSFVTMGSMCDASGNLLFFTNGINVYNRFAKRMPNGDSLSYPSEWYNLLGDGMSSSQGAVILPKPNDTSQYYIFHYTSTDTIVSGGGYEATHLYYSIVDMREDSGRGDLTAKNVPIIENEILSFSRLSACRHANGRDWWIIKNAWHTNIYYEFLLTPDSLIGPFVQQVGPQYGVGVEQAAYSIFSQDGSKYASFTDQSNVMIFNFNRCSGLLSNPISFFNSDSYNPTTDPNSGGCSGAFSPNGRFFYITNRLELNQYDLSVTPVHDSVRLQTLTDTTDHFQMDIMQLAPNAKIYVSCWNGGKDSIHVINQPDSFGVACDFKMYGQPVNTISPINLPYFPNYRLGALAGSCDTIHTSVRAIADARPAFASVAPNPALDQASLFYSTNSNSQNRAEIFDMTGNLIWNSNTVGSSGNININLSAMPAGIYLVRFTADDNILLNTKLVVTK